MPTSQVACFKAEIAGTVQGVGFRPFVYRLARQHKLTGFVLNDGCGVSVEIEGPLAKLSIFFEDLMTLAPPASQIEYIKRHETPVKGYKSFEIHESTLLNEKALVAISPDLGTCDDCMNELWDPSNRRYFYPFTNCTNCGPRFTIVSNVPYDRANTTMASFKMCEACRREYDDPTNRRFHAQPNACSTCGPNLTLLNNVGQNVPLNNDNKLIIYTTVKLLKEGKIVAIKGLGGFHLVCDALNSEAVSTLRARKMRYEKPLAVMFADINAAATFAAISDAERAALLSQARPIVCVEKRGSPVFDEVAPHNKFLGIMLPYTPLHELLMKTFGGPLVMTSGNRSDEPIVTDNDTALSRLKGIADYFLIHNRDINTRCDDSVLRITKNGLSFLRRSRGFAPHAIMMPDAFLAPIFAAGSRLKNTFCFTRGREVIFSHHLGDLGNPEALASFEEGFEHFKRLFDIEPEYIAHDLHPDYQTSICVKKKFGIQHHHAHIVSCMAENNFYGKVIGLALDGTGYGPDGTIWGGEILVADQHDFTRIGHIRYASMPGGDQAIKQPWRAALSLIADSYPHSEALDIIETLFPELTKQTTTIIMQMLKSGTGCYRTSSCGRLFDGVSAILGLCRETSFEAQAAIALEMAALETASKQTANPYSFEIQHDPGSLAFLQLDWRGVIRKIIEDLMNHTSSAIISERFHTGLARSLCEAVIIAANRFQINTVAMSGGCLHNEILRQELGNCLESKGLKTLFQKQLPSGDGGIALGQAVIANARLVTSHRE